MTGIPVREAAAYVVSLTTLRTHPDVTTTSAAPPVLKDVQRPAACAEGSTPRRRAHGPHAGGVTPGRGAQLLMSMTPRQRVALGLDPSLTSISGDGGGTIIVQPNMISPGRSQRSSLTLSAAVQ